MISGIDISMSGMKAQRLRMEMIANNLANIGTTSSRTETVRTPEGDTFLRHIPYRRKMVLFEAGIPGKSKEFGVSTPVVADDDSDFRWEHNPGHPHSVRVPGAADAGRVYFPNVNPIVEHMNMLMAMRAYEANVQAVDTLKAMGAANSRILA